MTALMLQSAAMACVLCAYTAARRPQPGTPLWMLPPLPVFEYRPRTLGAVESWSPKAEVTAVDQGCLPLTTAEYRRIQADVEAQTCRELDAIEDDFRAGLEWLEATVAVWLDRDAEVDHAYHILSHETIDPALIETVLA